MKLTQSVHKQVSPARFQLRRGLLGAGRGLLGATLPRLPPRFSAASLIFSTYLAAQMPFVYWFDEFFYCDRCKRVNAASSIKHRHAFTLPDAHVRSDSLTCVRSDSLAFVIHQSTDTKNKNCYAVEKKIIFLVLVTVCSFLVCFFPPSKSTWTASWVFWRRCSPASCVSILFCRARHASCLCASASSATKNQNNQPH